MCGWFAITTTRLNRIEGTLGITFPEVGPRYNISPSQSIPVIREFTDETHELVKMRWGLVPHWSKEPRPPTAPTAPSTPAPSPGRGAGVPRPLSVEALPHPGVGFLRIEDRDRPQTAILPDCRGRWRACLRRPLGRMVRARGAPPVLYHRGRPANALVAEIHNRVVILPEEAYATWLNPRTSLDTVRSLMEPYPGLPV